MADQQNSEKG
jgi:translation initiation factor 5A